MTTLTLALSDEDAQKLRLFAQRAGVNIEDAARIAIKTFNDKSADAIEPEDPEFQKEALELLKENAELYRRLA